MAKEKKKLSRRKAALLWMLLVAIVFGVLIAYEQISVLYVLVSVGLIVLLFIVGFADLERVGRPDDQETAAR
jgi:uncharacterized membrane protein